MKTKFFIILFILIIIQPLSTNYSESHLILNSNENSRSSESNITEIIWKFVGIVVAAAALVLTTYLAISTIKVSLETKKLKNLAEEEYTEVKKIKVQTLKLYKDLKIKLEKLDIHEASKIEKRPSQNNDYLTKATESFNLGDYETASHWYFFVTNNNPHNANYWAGYANTLLYLNKLDEALEIVEKAIHLDSICPTFNTRGQISTINAEILFEKREYLASKKILSEVLKENKSYKKAQRLLEQCKIKLNEDE